MAKITVTIEGSTIGKTTIVQEYSQENSDRFVAWLMANYGETPDGSQRDLEGVVNAYWQAVAAGTHANIERWERDQAAEQARAAVAPMVAL